IPNPEHRAVQMTRAEYDKDDYIIGMDSWNIRNILRITGGDPNKKIYKLLDFSQRGGDIADPWYTGDFETTYRDVYEGCEGLMEVLNGETN
ncbi:MAG: low molecular weight phosphotyrosine protein phosphatase, partial [Candidatus Ornithomonoglobus sp.]